MTFCMDIELPPIRPDFGEGFYYTPQYEVATQYAGEGGVILAHTWDERDAVANGLTVKKLDGYEWERTVKWFDAHANIRNRDVLRNARVELREDFVCGKISEDQFDILICNRPTPSESDQIVARTDMAREYMYCNLVGIFCCV
jgi:hypothetical protein